MERVKATALITNTASRIAGCDYANNRRLLVRLAFAFFFYGSLFCFAQSVTNTVPGSADPYLAGMPEGATASLAAGGIFDVAPAQSPVQVIGLPIVSGSALNFTAEGLVRWSPAQTYWSPDGQTDLNTAHTAGAENGISDITAPANALVGVFLGPDRPDSTSAPSALDFATPTGRDYLSIGPQLKQVFFIGDGHTSANILQRTIVPAGATRLFLGTMDSRGWYNNDGQFTVEVTAEASLSVRQSGNNVIVTWPTNSGSYTLYACSNLSPIAIWQPVSTAFSDSGQFTVTNETGSRAMFFRLQGH